MRKVLTAGVAALTLAGAVAGAAAPAQADPHWHGGWGGGWRGGWHGDDAGWAIGAGLLGLAAGAALSNAYRPHYYYGPAYYPGPGYYNDGYATCVSHRRIWDPYYGGYIVRSFRYAC
jgi:hypothetical protein